MNKKLIYGSLTFLTGCIVFYLMGCFVEASFNIKNWSEEARGLVGVFGVFISGIITGISQNQEHFR